MPGECGDILLARALRSCVPLNLRSCRYDSHLASLMDPIRAFASVACRLYLRDHVLDRRCGERFQRQSTGPTSQAFVRFGRITSTSHARTLILRFVMAMASGPGLTSCAFVLSSFFRFAAPSLSPDVTA